MGIVMALVMLAGLIVILKNNRQATVTKAVALLLLLGGLWNALWYGLSHLGDFWGAAALVSGLVMIAAALFLWLSVNGKPQKVAFKILLACALGLSFLLYFVTLVQLNLGYDIIG